MAMHNPARPGELIRETIEGIREETSERLPLEEVAKGLGTTRKTHRGQNWWRHRGTPSLKRCEALKDFWSMRTRLSMLPWMVRLSLSHRRWAPSRLFMISNTSHYTLR